MNNKAKRIRSALILAGHSGIHVRWSPDAQGYQFRSDQHSTWTDLGPNVDAAIQSVKRRHTLETIRRKGVA